MVNEVLYMETRLFREFCLRANMPAAEANELFEKYKIWGYIESRYDSLHLSGDDCALNEIFDLLKKEGARI